MKTITINRRKTTCFSDFSNQINDNQNALQKYIQTPFSIDAFEKQIKLKKDSFSQSQRDILHTVVSNQMASYVEFDKLNKNINLLKEENTFTITAGHQLNLFGGPLYVAYKIMDAIRLAEKLKEKYPNQNFVPIFWMATEDHDFEEINHLHLFHDTMTWGAGQKGPVGRFSLEGIEQLKEQIIDRFDNNPEFVVYIESFYKKENLAKSTTEFMVDLFGKYGLIALDADDAKLKKSFAPLMKKEIETHFS